MVGDIRCRVFICSWSTFCTKLLPHFCVDLRNVVRLGIRRKSVCVFCVCLSNTAAQSASVSKETWSDNFLHFFETNLEKNSKLWSGQKCQWSSSVYMCVSLTCACVSWCLYAGVSVWSCWLYVSEKSVRHKRQWRQWRSLNHSYW